MGGSSTLTPTESGIAAEHHKLDLRFDDKTHGHTWREFGVIHEQEGRQV